MSALCRSLMGVFVSISLVQYSVVEQHMKDTDNKVTDIYTSIIEILLASGLGTLSN